MTTRVVLSSLLALALATPALHAEISRQERKQAKKMFDDRDLYMRFNAPCTKGRHPYGVYYAPLVEVSPEGANAGAEGGTDVGFFHAQGTVFEIRINDPVELDELDWEEDEGSVEIELEGVGPADDRKTVIELVGIRSLADFERAFAHAFSARPLQEEHPDWPEAIRDAIASRRLEQGMNKRQAYYVVGAPERVEKREEDGRKVEIWTLPDQGVEFGFWGVKSGSGGAGGTLRFEDGLLTSSLHSGAGLDLDNP